MGELGQLKIGHAIAILLMCLAGATMGQSSVESILSLPKSANDTGLSLGWDATQGCSFIRDGAASGSGVGFTFKNGMAGLGHGYTNPTALLQVGGAIKADTLWVGAYSMPVYSSGEALFLGGNTLVLDGNYVHVYGHMTIEGQLDCSNQTVIADTVVCDVVKINNWKIEAPDYVFSPTYQLPGLSKVEQYVKHNQHLPGVPSARQMKDKGVDLAQMNMTLLKKVEELTLYVIEQNKKIEALEAKMSGTRE